MVLRIWKLPHKTCDFKVLFMYFGWFIDLVCSMSFSRSLVHSLQQSLTLSPHPVVISFHYLPFPAPSLPASLFQMSIIPSLSLSVCFLVRQCVVCVGGGLGSCKQLQPSSRCEEGVPGPKWHTTRLHRRQERRLPALHCKRQYTRPHGRTMHAYS